MLDSPLVWSLLRTHPNDVFFIPDPPDPSWSTWWHWAARDNCWPALVRAYLGHDNDDIPPILRSLITDIRENELDRTPISLSTTHPRAGGMSPKKSHEVARMTAYVASHIDHNEQVYIVDVGAGQGYLTRSLHAALGAHILAIDGDHHQTTGAKRWEAKSNTPIAGSITYTTTRVDAASLESAIDNWVHHLGKSHISIILVALHACGSLTVDILRSLFHFHTSWSITKAIIVGCCYNLLKQTDFPLSSSLSLPPSAFHLAAQVPQHWFDTSQSTSAVSLAIRKVVWRAILASLLPQPHPDHVTAENPTQTSTPPLLGASHRDTGTGSTPVVRSLGRLNDSAYISWSTFLSIALPRLGINPAPTSTLPYPSSPELKQHTNRLEVLHVLRCLLGPVIESTIIRDRVQWVTQELARIQLDKQVHLVNLFDQASGSGRNIAIVIS